MYNNETTISRSLPLILITGFGTLLAILMGLVAASANTFMLLATFALLGGLFVLAAPPTWTIWLLFLSAFLTVGPIMYFTNSAQILYLPPLLAASLLPQLLGYFLRRSSYKKPAPVPAPLFALLAFFISASVSTAVSQPSLTELIAASRLYLFLFVPVLLGFMLGVFNDKTIQSLWNFLLIVTLLQLPLAIYQYLVVSKNSVRTSPSDAVVGTFPGKMDAGGESGAMGIFIVVVLLLAIALWRFGKLSGFRASLVSFFGLGTLALAEVKAAVLLLPIVIAIYYRRDLFLHPIQAIIATLAAVSLAAAILTGYKQWHYELKATPDSDTATEKVQKQIDPAYGVEGGRGSRLMFWWNINVGRADHEHALFGYGVGATQSTSFGDGKLVGRFPEPYHVLDETSTTMLLWETGIVGHVLFGLTLLVATLTSRKLSRSNEVPELHRLFLRVGAISLFLLFITLPYKTFVVKSIPMQLLTMLLLGQAAYWQHSLRNTARDINSPCPKGADSEPRSALNHQLPKRTI